MEGEIFVVPFFGQGHLFPCTELCKHLSSRNFKIVIIIPSHISSSIPSTLRLHPLVEIAEINAADSGPPPPRPRSPRAQGPFDGHHQQLRQGIESFLSARSDGIRPACAVIDVMMSWSKHIFAKHSIPTVSLFTSGACSAAMEYAAWKANVHDMGPADIRILPGLPPHMTLSYSDLETRPPPPPPPQHEHEHAHSPPPEHEHEHEHEHAHSPPPGPGQQPPWLDDAEASIALLINTCDDLELPFINYVSNQIRKPVWAVGPLLPEQYWKSFTLLHDHQFRPNPRPSNYTEQEVIQWLDSKPRASVIYVSFGSEVGPTRQQYTQLATALQKSNRPFIWVIQLQSGSGPPHSNDTDEGYSADGVDEKVGHRGLIIRGWAPQLLILSHHSTGGFLSHCGWNSAVEAIGCGVPILAWPIRGDQYFNAKLVVAHLKLGYMVVSTGAKVVVEEDILQGIEKLMEDDEEVSKRAAAFRDKFHSGFPPTSVIALDAFTDFITQQPHSVV